MLALHCSRLSRRSTRVFRVLAVADIAVKITRRTRRVRCLSSREKRARFFQITARFLYHRNRFFFFVHATDMYLEIFIYGFFTIFLF